MAKKYEYALYKGDEFIDLGTADYLAEKMGVTRNYVKFLASPSARKRRTKGEDSNCCICVRLEIEEEEAKDVIQRKNRKNRFRLYQPSSKDNTSIK